MSSRYALDAWPLKCLHLGSCLYIYSVAPAAEGPSAEPHTHIGKKRKPMSWFSRILVPRALDLLWTFRRSDAKSEVESGDNCVLELAPAPGTVIPSFRTWHPLSHFHSVYIGHEIVFSHPYGIKSWDRGNDAKIIRSNGILIFGFTWHVKFFKHNKKEFIHFFPVVFITNVLVQLVSASESLEALLWTRLVPDLSTLTVLPWVPRFFVISHGLATRLPISRLFGENLSEMK